MQLTISLRELNEVKMTVNGHVEGSKGSHNEVKEDDKTIGIKRRTSQENINKKITEIKGLRKMMALLQRSEEDRNC